MVGSCKATRGFWVGHVGPEAAVGGPIGLIENGDIITMDAVEGTIELEVVKRCLLSARRAGNRAKPITSLVRSGAMRKTVGSAQFGAVAHPGAKSETHVYMDL